MPKLIRKEAAIVLTSDKPLEDDEADHRPGKELAKMTIGPIIGQEKAAKTKKNHRPVFLASVA